MLNLKLLDRVSNFSLIFTFTHFMLLVSFYTPWKYQKVYDFQMFAGCIERDEWQIGLMPSEISFFICVGLLVQTFMVVHLIKLSMKSEDLEGF